MNGSDMVETVLEVFKPSLFDRDVINTHLLDQIRRHGQDAVFELAALLGNSWSWMVEFKLFSFCIILVGGLLGVGMGLRLGRRLDQCLQSRFLGEKGEEVLASQLVGVQRALIWAIMPSFSLYIGFLITKFSFDYNKISSTSLMPLYQNVTLSVIMMALVIAANKALLSLPISAVGRITMEKATARRLLIATLMLLALVAIDDILATALTDLGFPSSFITALNLHVVALVFLSTSCLLYKRQGMHLIQFCVLLIAIVAFFIALAGYVQLGMFIVKFLSVFAAFLPLIALVLILSCTLTVEGSFAATLYGRCLAQRFVLSTARLDQIGLAVGLAVGTVLLATIALLILALSGFSASHIGAAVLHLLIGVEIGSVFISPLSLLVGFMFFLASLSLWRWFSKTIDGTVLARSHIDTGVRHSIRTVSGYVGLGLAALIGISAAGINLSSLAIIAGGLSLGIGFGMQNIVQNFVSGLILLAARPFKVGDFVEIGSITGSVRQISFRATQIETLENRSVIIPNSAFINSNVSNWTPHGLSGQIALSFTLPARDAPDDMLGQLLELLRQTPQVLPSPPPEGELTSFSDKDFTFSLYAHIADIRAIHKVKTALNLAVYKKFFHQEEQGE